MLSQSYSFINCTSKPNHLWPTLAWPWPPIKGIPSPVINGSESPGTEPRRKQPPMKEQGGNAMRPKYPPQTELEGSLIKSILSTQGSFNECPPHQGGNSFWKSETIHLLCITLQSFWGNIYNRKLHCAAEHQLCFEGLRTSMPLKMPSLCFLLRLPEQCLAYLPDLIPTRSLNFKTVFTSQTKTNNTVLPVNWRLLSNICNALPLWNILQTVCTWNDWLYFQIVLHYILSYPVLRLIWWWGFWEEWCW